MMEYSKRTKRIDMPRQLRVEPELAEDVHFIARMNSRPISHQILHWVREGVKADKRRFSQGASGAEPISVRKSQNQSERDIA